MGFFEVGHHRYTVNLCQLTQTKNDRPISWFEIFFFFYVAWYSHFIVMGEPICKNIDPCITYEPIFWTMISADTNATQADDSSLIWIANLKLPRIAFISQMGEIIRWLQLCYPHFREWLIALHEWGLLCVKISRKGDL